MRIRRLPQRKAFASFTAVLFAVSTVTWAAASRFDFTAVGNFKRMNHTGDTGGQVRLADLPQSAGSWGMGALAGLKGELLLRDGRLLVSRGDDPLGRVTAAQAGDEAVLFAAARVRQWAEVPLPSDMSQRQFEAFVLEQAKALGLDGREPFPFLVQGRYPRLTWHVLTGQPARGVDHAGHGHGHGGGGGGGAGKRLFEQPGAGGELVGMYSGVEFEGVVSHPGERFHIHYADDAARVSGHVDAYAVARGGLLRLPLQ
jgi:hypothetical protein